MLYDQCMEAVAMVQRRSSLRPALALILGSGLGDLVHELQDAVAISYADIPHFPRSTVAGHAGHLHLGLLEGVPVVVMQGRFHLYEGYSPQLITLPVRVMHLLGAHTLLVTNAAGGVNPDYHPGDFMLIRDHISLPTLAGLNPLVGPNDPRFGERFPSLANAYDPQLCALAQSVASTHPGISLHEGIYAMVAGPSYETAAELRFLRLIGTDAVGMSTVPEVIVAGHFGMRVLGMSLITNAATGSEQVEVSHAEVLATADAARTRFTLFVRELVQKVFNAYPSER